MLDGSEDVLRRQRLNILAVMMMAETIQKGKCLLTVHFRQAIREYTKNQEKEDKRLEQLKGSSILVATSRVRLSG